MKVSVKHSLSLISIAAPWLAPVPLRKACPQPRRCRRRFLARLHGRRNRKVVDHAFETHRIPDACQTPDRLWSDCRSSNALRSLKAFTDKITSGNETEGEIGRRYLVMYHRTSVPAKEELHGRSGIRIHVQTQGGYALQPINI